MFLLSVMSVWYRSECVELYNIFILFVDYTDVISGALWCRVGQIQFLVVAFFSVICLVLERCLIICCEVGHVYWMKGNIVSFIIYFKGTVMICSSVLILDIVELTAINNLSFKLLSVYWICKIKCNCTSSSPWVLGCVASHLFSANLKVLIAG